MRLHPHWLSVAEFIKERQQPFALFPADSNQKRREDSQNPDVRAGGTWFIPQNSLYLGQQNWSRAESSSGVAIPLQAYLIQPDPAKLPAVGFQLASIAFEQFQRDCPGLVAAECRLVMADQVYDLRPSENYFRFFLGLSFFVKE